MTQQHQGLTALKKDSSSYSSYSSLIMEQCEKLVTLFVNKTTGVNDQQFLPIYIQQALSRPDLKLRTPLTAIECTELLIRLANGTNEIDSIINTNRKTYDIQEHSHTLIIFVIFIGVISLISIIGNLCLAKVLYVKRFHLLQTDRIVLCLALSKKRKFYQTILSSIFYTFR